MKGLLLLVVMTAFLGCASTQKQSSAGEYVDDTVITTKVKAAIFDEPTLKTMQINVETFKGEVQLSGFVDSAQSVNKAGEVARGVKGVISVKNDLIVK
jgi:osmotically-inducible protein OsmY